MGAGEGHGELAALAKRAFGQFDFGLKDVNRDHGKYLADAYSNPTSPDANRGVQRTLKTIALALVEPRSRIRLLQFSRRAAFSQDKHFQ